MHRGRGTGLDIASTGLGGTVNAAQRGQVSTMRLLQGRRTARTRLPQVRAWPQRMVSQDQMTVTKLSPRPRPRPDPPRSLRETLPADSASLAIRL